MGYFLVFVIGYFIGSIAVKINSDTNIKTEPEIITDMETAYKELESYTGNDSGAFGIRMFRPKLKTSVREMGSDDISKLAESYNAYQRGRSKSFESILSGVMSGTSRQKQYKQIDVNIFA
jgi:hypothetical protein